MYTGATLLCSAFSQRAGALKILLIRSWDQMMTLLILNIPKANAKMFPTVVGIELGNSSELNSLIERMKAFKFYGEYLNNKPDLFQFLV